MRADHNGLGAAWINPAGTALGVWQFAPPATKMLILLATG
jgi:hypothetical protein